VETSTLIFQTVSQAVQGSAPCVSPSLPDGAVLNPLRKYTMEKPTKEQIIHRAYELWEHNGKPEGDCSVFGSYGSLPCPPFSRNPARVRVAARNI